MFMKLRLFFLTAFAIGASLVASASDLPPGTGDESSKRDDIVGGVYHSESKKPLSSVTITATNLASKKEKVVSTDEWGNYSFSDLEAGIYKFIFTKGGYKKVVKDKVQIRQDEAFQIDVALTPHSAYEFLPAPFTFGE